MKKTLLTLSLLISFGASAEGVIRTGGIIGPHPQDFTYRFNAIRGDMPVAPARIQISTAKGAETKALGNGVTLITRKADSGDAFKSIQVNCTGLRTEQRLFACMSGIAATATSIDTSINERDFFNIVEQAVKTGSATHNQSGVDYVIKANTRAKTISMLAKADAPERIEKMGEVGLEPGLTDTLQVVPCNPAIHKCR